MSNLKLCCSLVLLAACVDEPAPSGPFVSSNVATIDLPGYGPPNLDLLVVIDDTAMMQPYQAKIAELPALLQATTHTLFDGLGTFRVAIATNAGTLRTSGSIPDGYLEDAGHFDRTRTTNYDGSMAAALATVTNVGTAGSTSQPLAAMQTALDAPFSRDDAYLAIVMISASDDTSPGETSAFASMLKSRRDDPADVAVIGIIDPSAPRLGAFLQAFPNRNTTTPIAAVDWTDAFALLGRLARVPLGAPCFVQPLDLDPESPGDQVECSFVWEDRGVEHRLPMCGSVEPCFALVPSPQICGVTAPNLIEVSGWGGVARPHIRGQCVTK